MTPSTWLTCVVLPILVIIAGAAVKHFAGTLFDVLSYFPRLRERVATLEAHDYDGLRQEVKMLRKEFDTNGRRLERLETDMGAVKTTTAETHATVESIATSVRDIEQWLRAAPPREGGQNA